MKSVRYEFQLVKDGKVHYQGFRHEIARLLHCQRIEVDEAYKYDFDLQGFRVKRVLSNRKFELSIKEDKPIEVVSNEDKKLKYLVRHLEQYGNTVYQGKRLNYYKQELANLGIKVKSRRVKYAEDKRERFVLEVIKDDS